MSIELQSEVVKPPAAHINPMPIKRITFKSRSAVFWFETNERQWHDFAVRFYVGPIGLTVTPDEAEAIGRAMVECAEHYRSVAGGAA